MATFKSSIVNVFSGAMRDASAARERTGVSVAQRVDIRRGRGLRMRAGVPASRCAAGLLPRQWALGQAPAQVPRYNIPLQTYSVSV